MTKPPRPLILLFALSCVGPTVGAQLPDQRLPKPKAMPGLELLVSGYTNGSVYRFSPVVQGSLLGHLGSPGEIAGAQSVRQGPDGLLYVVAEEQNEVRRYRRSKFVDRFVWDDPITPMDETGGLSKPTSAIFGPNGNLFVGGFVSDSVHEYDRITGDFVGVFVAANAGGLNGPDAGMVFGPDGNLYVPSFYSHQVLRYDGTSGSFMDVFIPAGNGLQNPRVVLFLPGGDVLVSSWGRDRVLLYDSEGSFLANLVTYRWPTGMAIGPHDGLLYVTSDQQNRVWKFDMVNLVKMGTIVPTGTAGLNGATFLQFHEPFGPHGIRQRTR